MGVVFSPDGRRVAAISHDGQYGAGGSTWSTCQVWDAATGRPVSPLLPHINWPSALAFSPDGKVLATGDYSRTVHRWDVETGARIGRPFATGGPVVRPGLQPRWPAAGGRHGRARVSRGDLGPGLRSVPGRADRVPALGQEACLQPGWCPPGHRVIGWDHPAGGHGTDQMTSHLLQSGTIASIVFTGTAGM